MDCIEFQSLIGIIVDATERKQLTPLSTDVFVSIPDRDSIPLLFEQNKAPPSFTLSVEQ